MKVSVQQNDHTHARVVQNNICSIYKSLYAYIYMCVCVRVVEFIIYVYMVEYVSEMQVLLQAILSW